MPNYKSAANGSRRAQTGLVSFGFFVLSVIALYLPDASQDEVASLLRGSLLRPFVLAQEGLVRRSIHAEDTEVLQRQLDSLEAVIANSSTLSEENGRLRGLLTLSNRSPAQYVAASVIRSGTPGSESMFVLNKGTRDGVTNDSPVIMGSGLLGRVLEDILEQRGGCRQRSVKVGPGLGAQRAHQVEHFGGGHFAPMRNNRSPPARAYLYRYVYNNSTDRKASTRISRRVFLPTKSQLNRAITPAQSAHLFGIGDGFCWRRRVRI